ncbi:MAG: hypothetical protein E7234_02085 [Lachnospiraceae bacterium]|jgi:hypothetical protein|nr:hypothetical protein [Lachnospiraceae bacterium]
MANEKLKKEIKESGLYIWQVAEAYGCTDGNFSRKLRKEFSEDEEHKIRCIMENLKAKGA